MPVMATNELYEPYRATSELFVKSQPVHPIRVSIFPRKSPSSRYQLSIFHIKYEQSGNPKITIAQGKIKEPPSIPDGSWPYGPKPCPAMRRPSDGKLIEARLWSRAVWALALLGLSSSGSGLGARYLHARSVYTIPLS